MNNNNIDTIELSEKIKKKRLISKIYVIKHLKKITEINPKINAVSQIFSEEYIDKQLKELDKNAPFFGIPLLLKDLGIYLPGQETNHCSQLFRGDIANFESEIY